MEVRACDAEGRFTLPAGGEALALCVDHPGAARYVWVSGPQRLEPPKLGKTLHLQPVWAFVGKLQRPDGTPAAGASVQLMTIGTHTYMPLRLHPRVAPSATSAADGTFSLPGMTLNGAASPPGADLRVRATFDGHPWAGGGPSSYGPEVADEPFTLRPAVTLRGRLLDATTGAPLAGASLWLQASTYEGGFLRSGPDGSFAFTEVPTHRPRALMIQHPSQHGIETWVRELDVQELEPGGVESLELKLRTPVRVSGRVLDAHSGEPALTPLSLSVQARDTPAPSWRQSVDLAWGNVGQDARVAADGRFSLWSPGGEVSLEVSSFDRNRKAYQQSFSLTLTGQEPALELEVERRPGVLFRMTLSPPAGPRSERWKRLLTSVGPSEGAWTSYAESGPVWFFPTEGWGRSMTVRVEERGPEERVQKLAPTRFEANPDAWPVEIRLR